MKQKLQLLSHGISVIQRRLIAFWMLIPFFGFTITIYAQEAVSTAGNYGKTTYGSLSWTVGEPVIETIKDGNSTLTQGFQQSRLTVTAIYDLKVPDIELSVYPNPTNSFLSIEVKTDKQRDLLLSLFDINGKLILQNNMAGNKQSIKMQNYKPATYILKITEANKEIKTYKIVKH
ncbi:MAG: T9SS type A sorting domain-containing protein [Bacteroidales bacterium]|nr:T9SS type A sorting domain-containing protein [Bacteroidales bacterium]